jgi:hypothetical protein
VTLGPLRITPVTEATNARKNVAFSDLIASKSARVLVQNTPTLSLQRESETRNRRWFQISSYLGETSVLCRVRYTSLFVCPIRPLHGPR